MNEMAPVTHMRERALRRLTSHWQSVVAYTISFFLSIAGAVWVYRLRPSDLTVPWQVNDTDMSSVYSLAQALGQSWTSLVHHSLGAPFTADLSLAFIPDDLHLFIIRILVHLTHNPFTAINGFFVLTFGLCGVSFLYTCNRLGFKAPVSVAISVAYAWLPYHFTRMAAGHVFLAAYYMIPLGVLVLINLIKWQTESSNRFIPRSRPRQILAVLTVVAVGSSGAYYALFLGLLTFSTLFLVPRRGLSIREMATRAAVTVVTGVGFVSAPIFRNQWAEWHGLTSVLTRSPLESIQWGGSISRLLVPWGIWIPHKMAPLVEKQEFEWLAVPALAVLGTWILLVGLLRHQIGNKGALESSESGALQYLFIWSLLLYAAGGLSVVFAYAVDSSFRTWNRFAVVIMTLALLAVARVLSASRIEMRKTFVVSAGVLLLSGATQLRPLAAAGISAEPDLTAQQQFRVWRTAAEIIQREVPEGCSILQLPIMAFPEGGTVDGVGNGDHLWLPLLTRNLRWSYGAPKGSVAGDFWTKKSLTIVNATNTAHEFKFCAVFQVTRNELDFTTPLAWRSMRTPVGILLVDSRTHP